MAILSSNHLTCCRASRHLSPLVSGGHFLHCSVWRSLRWVLKQYGNFVRGKKFLKLSLVRRGPKFEKLVMLDNNIQYLQKKIGARKNEFSLLWQLLSVYCWKWSYIIWMRRLRGGAGDWGKCPKVHLEWNEDEMRYCIHCIESKAVKKEY